MKSKFWTSLTLLVIASLVLLTGCGPTPAPPATEAPKAEATKAPEPTATPAPEPTATPAAPAAAEAVKVTIFVGFGTGTSPEQMEVHKQIQEEFNSTHQDIQIEFLTVPWEERITKFSTMLAGDMAPDIAMPIGVGGIGEFYDEWIDLTPFIEADKYDMSDFFGTTVEIHTYPNRGVLGLPLCVYPSVIFYNQDLFDAAGVDYPPDKFEAPYADGDPWTYDKLVEIAKKLTKDSAGNDANSPAFNWEKSVQWGWNGWDWEGNLKPWVQKFGDTRPTGVSEDGRTSLVNQKPWLDAAQFVKDTVWTWHIRANTEQGGTLSDATGDPMGSGKIAMWEINSWMGYAWPAWKSSFNWNAAAVPSVGSNKVAAEVDADTFVIPKSSKHQKEAWEVVKWLFQPEIMQKLTKNYSCIPARKSLAATWADDMKKDYPNVNFQVFLDSLNYIDKPNHESWTPAYTKINDAMNNANDQIMTGKNLDVQAVMDNVNTEVQGYLDEYWASKK
jgi:multiple sugar transport system substrate-binding protein